MRSAYWRKEDEGSGRKAQLTNIQAGKTVAGIVRTTLGPRAMLKMLLDPMGGIVMTNDGNAILREEEMRRVCDDILKVKPDLVITEKGDPKACACLNYTRVRKEKSKSIEGSRQYAYRAVGEALEVIPRSLAHNCGADVVRAMTDLRARHAASGNAHFGIDGKTGKVADMKALGIFDTFAVKQQTLRTSIEAAAMLLRIDDIISGISKKQRDKPSAVMGGDDETFGDSRDG
eukprot:Skav234008  [mRNA]  locus=scaffold3484:57662:71047:+ [translate_table: standard]